MTDWLVHVHLGYRSLPGIYVRLLNLRGLIFGAPETMISFVILKILGVCVCVVWGGRGVIGFPELAHALWFYSSAEIAVTTA